MYLLVATASDNVDAMAKPCRNFSRIDINVGSIFPYSFRVSSSLSSSALRGDDKRSKRRNVCLIVMEV